MKIPPDIIAFFHFGWSSATAMTLFCLAGNYLDKKWQTGPWFLLSGSLLGIITSTLLFISSLKKTSRKED